MATPKPKHCDKDAKGEHFFERIGYEDGYIVFRCTQCKKAYKEPVQFFEYRDCVEIKE